MKRFSLAAVAVAVVFSLSACGVSKEDFEAAQASAASLDSQKQALEAELADTKTTLVTVQDEADTLRTAEEERVAEQEAEASRKAEEKEAKEAAEKAQKEQENKAKKISKRELDQIVKNPDSHIGENVIFYARITQFDSGTGPCMFRAELSNVLVGKYDYEHNALFAAGDGVSECAELDDYVAEDLVKVTATVTGSLTYDTTIGGSTTVPKFQVVKIKRS